MIWWPSARTAEYSIYTEQRAWQFSRFSTCHVVSPVVLSRGGSGSFFLVAATEDTNELGDTAVFSDDDSEGSGTGARESQIEMTATPSRGDTRTKPRTQPATGDHFVIEDSEDDEDDEHGMIDTGGDEEADPGQWTAVAPQEEGNNGDAERRSPRGDESPVV